MDSLYDQDLVLWSEAQARELRSAAAAGLDAPIDWQHVAEEIESLGSAERRTLASNIAAVIEHLLKLQASPAIESVPRWRDSVRRARGEIEGRLEESPSLRCEVATMIARETPRARALVRASFEDHGEQPMADIDAIVYSE